MTCAGRSGRRKALFASPLFTIGWVIGAGAWVFHVAAMSVAPLSLVQAVLAGGMVLLAIMAEQMLGLPDRPPAVDRPRR